MTPGEQKHRPRRTEASPEQNLVENAVFLFAECRTSAYEQADYRTRVTSAAPAGWSWRGIRAAHAAPPGRSHRSSHGRVHLHINTCSCIYMGLPDERHVCIVPQHFSYRTRGKQPWQTCVIVAHESTQVRTQVVRCSPVQPWFSRWRAHSQNHKRQPSYSAAHAPHSARAPESKCSKVLCVLYVTHSARVRSVSAVHTKLPLPCQ